MSKLQTLQQSVADHLSASPFFADANIAILTERIGNIEFSINSRVEAIGLCVIVVTPTANVTYGNAPGPYFDNIRIVCRVLESVVTNKTGITALAAAEEIVRLLHHFAPNDADHLTAVTPTIALGNDPDFLSYDCGFSASLTVTEAAETVDNVVITNSGGSITMTCATENAFIFYTTNGKPPVPHTGTRYLAPFATPASGTTIRAKAWLPGYLASKTETLSI